LAQRKEDRKAHLTSQYMQRMVNMSNIRMPQLGQVYNPTGSYFMPSIPQPQRFYSPAQIGQMRPSPRWATPGLRPAGGPAGFGSMQPPFRPARGTTPGQPRMGGRGIQGQQNLMNQTHPSQVRALNNGPQIAAAPTGPPPRPTAPVAPTFKYAAPLRAATAAGGHTTIPQQPASAVHIQGQEPLSATALAAAHPNDQKQMLGERLFPLIHEKFPTVAGKVTGMLLEMDNAEILHLLDDHELLNSRVEEAVTVLQMHQTKPPAQN